MAVSVACRECGASFSISPEHLGRKYRCKTCGAANVAEESKGADAPKRTGEADAARRKPTRKSSQQRAAGSSQRTQNPQKKRRPKPAPEPVADEYSYDYDEAEYESYEAYDEYEAVEEYQPSRSRSRQSSGKKKKRSSSKSSGVSIPWKKIGSVLGTIFLVLIIAGRVMRVINKVNRAVGNGQTVGNVEADELVLTEQSPVGGGFTVKLPNVLIEKPVPIPGTNEVSTQWTAVSGPFEFGVGKMTHPIFESMSLPDVTQSAKDQYSTGAGPITGSVVSEVATSLGAKQAVELQVAITQPTTGSGYFRFVLDGDTMWAVGITREGAGEIRDSLRQEFFNSFQFKGANSETGVSSAGTDSNQSATETTSAVASPTQGNRPTAAPSFDSQRLQFKTRLVRQGPSPQPYENEAPPPGVEQVKYQSEGRDLMAWLARPANAQGDVPAVVYFHGGFAFGASDFEDTRPFLQSGFAVMTPTLRGENGNPGNFEMLGGEYIDACNAVRWLSKQPGIDGEHIYAFGHSVGGSLSALLSLAENIPLRQSGSAGGLYPPQVFQSWADECPFNPADENECRMRLLSGNDQSMQRKHYAYLGIRDELRTFAAPLINRAGNLAPQLYVVTKSGDHFSSLGPAIMGYINEIRLDLMQSGGKVP